MEEDRSGQLQALPTLLIQSDGGIRLRRGCVEFRVDGERAAEIVQRVLAATRGRRASPDEICESFAVPDRPAVRELIVELEKRQILTSATVEEVEGPLEIFYWHFGERIQTVNARLRGQPIAIVGANCISRQLVACLAACGVTEVDIVDDPLLRNRRLFDGGARLVPNEWPLNAEPISRDAWNPATLGCLVATSDVGGARHMREWNAFCIERGCHFLPVVMQDLIGYVGPLVVPGETACFECMCARWNSNLAGLESRWEVLDSGSRDVVGFHPAMSAMLGAMVAFELTKFYGIQLPFSAIGHLIEVNLLTMEMEARRVLRVPRCPACSSLNVRASASLTKSWFGFAQEEVQ
jgi:molybdopterin-synthase adenylyltransferase